MVENGDAAAPVATRPVVPATRKLRKKKARRKKRRSPSLPMTEAKKQRVAERSSSTQAPIPPIPQSWLSEASQVKVGDSTDGVKKAADSLQSILATGLQSYEESGQALGPKKPEMQTPEPDELEQVMHQALEADNFKIQGKLGSLWTYALKKNKELAANYARIGKGHQAPKKFRLEWLKEEKAAKVKTRMEKTKHTVENTSFGEYLAIPVAVQREGGDAAAVQAVQNYIEEAWRMTENKQFLGGNPWFLLNPMTKRVELLYVKLQFKDSLLKTWQMQTDYEPSAEKGQGSRPASKGDKGDKGKGKEGQDPPKNQPKKQDHFREQFNQAEKMKKEMQEVTTSSQDLLAVIANDPEWSYWNNVDALAPLRKARQALEPKKNQSPFWRQWVLQAKFAVYARKSFDDATIKKELAKMGGIQECVNNVRSETESLRAMQQARLKK